MESPLKILKNLTIAEIALIVSNALGVVGITAMLSGASVLSIYSVKMTINLLGNGKYSEAAIASLTDHSMLLEI